MLNLLQLSEKFSNKYFKIFLTLIVGFAFLFRSFNLANNPVAISHDELDYVLNGKMIALTGSDLTQTWELTSLTPIETETLTSELFPVLQAIIFRFLPLNLFNARLASIFFSSLTVLILGLLTEKITKNKLLALLTAITFALNPWSLLFAHTAYEAPNAIFFYLLGIYLLLSLNQVKPTKKAIFLSILSFLAFFIGFYTYHGYKLIFPLLVTIPVVWQWLTTDKAVRKNLIKPYLVFGFLLGILIIKVLISLADYGNRSAELIFMNQDFLANLVNSARKLGFDSAFSSFLLNKYTVLVREIAIRYLAVFNPTNLFITGTDSTILFSIFQSGYFYLIELPLVLIGCWFLHKKYNQVFYLLLSLLLISPLPAALHQGNSTALRAGFIFPIISIFIAGGWYQLFNLKGFFAELLKLVVLGSLVINLSYFIYIFQNNYPIYSADNYFFKERLLSQYLALSQDQNQEITVLSKNPYPGFRAYLFYQDKITKNSLDKLIPEFQKGVTAEYQFKNINWTNKCEVLNSKNLGYLIVEEELLTECQKPAEIKDWYQTIYTKTKLLPQFIASPIDSRNYYVLFNSDLCETDKLSGYVYNSSKLAYELEQLNKEEFCQKWVIRDSGLNDKLVNININLN